MFYFVCVVIFYLLLGTEDISHYTLASIKCEENFLIQLQYPRQSMAVLYRDFYLTLALWRFIFVLSVHLIFYITMPIFIHLLLFHPFISFSHSSSLTSFHPFISSSYLYSSVSLFLVQL